MTGPAKTAAELMWLPNDVRPSLAARDQMLGGAATRLAERIEAFGRTLQASGLGQRSREAASAPVLAAARRLVDVAHGR